MMDKELFNGIMSGLEEAVSYAEGKNTNTRVTIIEDPRVSEIRGKLELSRSQFARLIGVSVRTIEKWEQGVARPSGAARSLLVVADKNPRAVLEALH